MTRTRAILVFVAVGVPALWLWYFRSSPGPSMVGHVDYVIFESSRMYEAASDGAPRRYIKILRERNEVNRLTRLFSGNRYRHDSCACLPEYYFSFVESPTSTTVWGIETHSAFPVTRHWWSIRSVLSRGDDPSYGEKYYVYEFSVPDTIPITEIRSALNGKWLYLPQSDPLTTRELTVSVTHQVPAPTGLPEREAREYDGEARRHTQTLLTRLDAAFAKRYVSFKRSGSMSEELVANSQGSLTHTFSFSYLVPKTTDSTEAMNFILNLGGSPELTSRYSVRAAFPDPEPVPAEADLKHRIPAASDFSFTGRGYSAP